MQTENVQVEGSPAESTQVDSAQEQAMQAGIRRHRIFVAIVVVTVLSLVVAGVFGLAWLIAR